MVVDIAVMDGAWPAEARQRILENIFDALRAGLGADQPSPGWWVNFRVIGEGSWGSRGGVLSILDLLDTGAFSEERVAAIRDAIASRGRPARPLRDGRGARRRPARIIGAEPGAHARASGRDPLIGPPCNN
jgi:hypothetical protein